MLKFRMKNDGATILVLIILVAVAIAVGPFITMLCWWLVVPDVFGGMVREELVPATLTWWQAFKINVFLAGALGLSRGSSSKKE